MPIYEYACSTCGEDFEVLQKISDPPLKLHTCSPKSRVKRKLSLSAFQLKGGGWYKEGYSSPANGNGDSAPGGNGSGEGAKPGKSAEADSKASASSGKSDVKKPSGTATKST